MTAGLRVIGDQNNVQIDENLVNIVLVNSGKSTTQDDGTGRGIYLATITVTGISPIMAIDTYGQRMTQFQTQQSGNQFTFYIASPQSQTPMTFAWYIYDQVPNQSPAHTGLTVYNSSGRVTFSSDYEPFRMINYHATPRGGITFQLISGPPTQYITTLPAESDAYANYVGQKIAVITSSVKSYIPFDRTGTTGPTNKMFQSVVTFNSSSSLAYAATEGTNYPYIYVGDTYGLSGANSQTTFGGLILADVTNHYLP